MSVNPQCQRCKMSFDTRELLLTHSEVQHGDFMQARTREEYLKFRQDRGGDLVIAEQIPITHFMSVSKLKALMRAGMAKSDLYSVRTKKGHGGRKPKPTCTECGEKFQPTHGNQTRCATCRNPPKKVKMKNVFPQGRRKRRPRCAREKCNKLFQPKTQKGRRQIYCDDSCRAAAARDRLAQRGATKK